MTQAISLGQLKNPKNSLLNVKLRFYRYQRYHAQTGLLLSVYSVYVVLEISKMVKVEYSQTVL